MNHIYLNGYENEGTYSVVKTAFDSTLYCYIYEMVSDEDGDTTHIIDDDYEVVYPYTTFEELGLW